jgi:hypothetical protein
MMKVDLQAPYEAYEPCGLASGSGTATGAASGAASRFWSTGAARASVEKRRATIVWKRMFA